jgi:hypothetical protein
MIENTHHFYFNSHAAWASVIYTMQFQQQRIEALAARASASRTYIGGRVIAVPRTTANKQPTHGIEATGDYVDHRRCRVSRRRPTGSPDGLRRLRRTRARSRANDESSLLARFYLICDDRTNERAALDEYLNTYRGETLADADFLGGRPTRQSIRPPVTQLKVLYIGLDRRVVLTT